MDNLESSNMNPGVTGEKTADGEYHDLLRAGNAAQVEKLKRNAYKSGYEDIAFDYAWKRLKEEMHELNIALCLISLTDLEYENTLKNIRHEAADVANFAHMLIYKCDKLITDNGQNTNGK
jgi:hypothetical protein